MIRLERIYKAFGAQQVLRGVDLEIRKGALTTLIGRSGEGKSVLLKIVLGLLKPDEGRVCIDGVDFFSLSGRRRGELRKKFGMLFQNAALFDSMDVEENVAFPLREHGRLGEAAILQRVHEKLAQVGLKDMGYKMPAELSGGMKKRVGLARALMLQPEIILYDEPTAGLDPLLTDSINRLIFETQRKFCLTSVVVSHDIPAALQMSDRIAMLHEGKILAEGTPDDFKNSPHVFVRQFLAGKADPDFVG